MELNLSGKNVLVSGASRGIGLAIVNAFVGEGCKVVCNSRDKKTLMASIAGMDSCHGVAGDMSDPTQAKLVVSKAIEILGTLDLVVCNVGSGTSVPPGEESFVEWQRVFGLNFFSATNLVEASREALCETKGVVVCISSICGTEVIPGAPVTYTVAKAALNVYIKAISRPLGDEGVRVIGIAPGNVLFEGSGWDKRLRSDPQGTSMMLEREVPLSRFGTAEEVANTAVWCASEKAAFATGTIWVLDGGQVRS